MDKSSPEEQQQFDPSEEQIISEGSHWNAETVASKLTDIDVEIRKLNEEFSYCRDLIGVMMRQRYVLDGEMRRLFSYRNKWLKVLHRAENYRRNLTEMECRGLDKNRKKFNDPYDGLVMGTREATEFRARLDRLTNVIMKNMITVAKFKTKLQLERIDREHTSETLFALGARIAQQRRLAMDLRNGLMAIKNTIKY